MLQALHLRYMQESWILQLFRFLMPNVLRKLDQWIFRVLPYSLFEKSKKISGLTHVVGYSFSNFLFVCFFAVFFVSQNLPKRWLRHTGFFSGISYRNILKEPFTTFPRTATDAAVAHCSIEKLFWNAYQISQDYISDGDIF